MPKLKSSAPSVVQSPAFAAASGTTWLVERVSPSAAAAVALRAVTYSPRGRVRPAAAGVLAKAKQRDFDCEGYRVRSYHWGESKDYVYLLHGWGSRAADMAAFVQPLLDQGLSVVALDAPGHGASSGWRSNLRLFAAATAILWRDLGPCFGIISHSIGCSAALLALKELQPWPIPNLVLLSPQDDPVKSIERMGQALGLAEETQKHFVAKFEEYVGQPVADAHISRIAPQHATNVLVVHDKDDKLVPFSQGRAVAEAIPGATFDGTEGLGHYRVLSSKAVRERATQFSASIDSRSIRARL